MPKPVNSSYLGSWPVIDRQHFWTERFAWSTGSWQYDASPARCASYC